MYKFVAVLSEKSKRTSVKLVTEKETSTTEREHERMSDGWWLVGGTTLAHLGEKGRKQIATVPCTAILTNGTVSAANQAPKLFPPAARGRGAHCTLSKSRRPRRKARKVLSQPKVQVECKSAGARFGQKLEEKKKNASSEHTKHRRPMVNPPDRRR